MSNEQRDKPTSTLARVGRFLFSTAKGYLVIVRGGSEGAGLKTLAQLSRGGPLNWIGLAVLLLSLVATAYLVLQGQKLPSLSAETWDAEAVAVPTLALYLSLLVIAFGWAYLLVGAASASLGLYVLVATYVNWHSYLIGRTLTLWFGLLPVWTLILGAWSASSQPTHWRLPLLLLLSLVVAAFTFKLVGLYRILALTPGMIALGLVYLALVANPWALKARPLKPAIAFGLSLVLLLVYFALNLLRSAPADAFRNTFWDFYDLLGLAGLFWYWLGLDLFSGAHNMADWLLSTTKALLPPRLLKIVVFGLWTLWAIVTYPLIHTPPPWVMQPLTYSKVGMALLRAYGSIRLSDVLAWTLDYHLYITGAILLVAMLLLSLRKLTHERLMSLLGLFLFTFFALFGYNSLFLATKAADSAEVLGFWPLLIFLGGIFWQMLMASSDLVSGGGARSLLFLGFLLTVGAISLLELSAGYQAFALELSLNSLAGVLYLGLPYLLYTHFYQERRLTPVPVRQLLLLLALGMASAIPCLLAESLLPAPTLWLLAVLATTWRGGYWDEPQDGLVYALTLALGFVAFYTHRVWISIPAFLPFLARLEELQVGWELKILYPWQLEWWWILLKAAFAAAILGYLLSKAHAAKGRGRALFLILALMLSSAFLAVLEFVLR